MKGFLIFLAIAFPVVLVSPSFWSLVNMEWGVERIGYVHGQGANQVTQWATLGPKAAWPAWAVVPAGVRLTVSSNFESAPGHNAVGLGDIDGKPAPRDSVGSYRQQLTNGGWTVRVGRIDATSPDIPPRPIHMCIVEGRKGSQVQRMSVDIDDPQTTGSLWWTVGDAQFPAGTKDEPCWEG